MKKFNLVIQPDKTRKIKIDTLEKYLLVNEMAKEKAFALEEFTVQEILENINMKFTTYQKTKKLLENGGYVMLSEKDIKKVRSTSEFPLLKEALKEHRNKISKIIK